MNPVGANIFGGGDRIGNYNKENEKEVLQKIKANVNTLYENNFKSNFKDDYFKRNYKPNSFPCELIRMNQVKKRIYKKLEEKYQNVNKDDDLKNYIGDRRYQKLNEKIKEIEIQEIPREENSNHHYYSESKPFECSKDDEVFITNNDCFINQIFSHQKKKEKNVNICAKTEELEFYDLSSSVDDNREIFNPGNDFYPVINSDDIQINQQQLIETYYKNLKCFINSYIQNDNQISDFNRINVDKQKVASAISGLISDLAGERRRLFQLLHFQITYDQRQNNSFNLLGLIKGSIKYFENQFKEKAKEEIRNQNDHTEKFAEKITRNYLLKLKEVKTISIERERDIKEWSKLFYSLRSGKTENIKSILRNLSFSSNEDYDLANNLFLEEIDSNKYDWLCNIVNSMDPEQNIFKFLVIAYQTKMDYILPQNIVPVLNMEDKIWFYLNQICPFEEKFKKIDNKIKMNLKSVQMKYDKEKRNLNFNTLENTIYYASLFQYENCINQLQSSIIDGANILFILVNCGLIQNISFEADLDMKKRQNIDNFKSILNKYNSLIRGLPIEGEERKILYLKHCDPEYLSSISDDIINLKIINLLNLYSSNNQEYIQLKEAEIKEILGIIYNKIKNKYDFNLFEQIVPLLLFYNMNNEAIMILMKEASSNLKKISSILLSRAEPINFQPTNSRFKVEINQIIGSFNNRRNQLDLNQMNSNFKIFMGLCSLEEAFSKILNQNISSSSFFGWFRNSSYSYSDAYQLIIKNSVLPFEFTGNIINFKKDKFNILLRDNGQIIIEVIGEIFLLNLEVFCQHLKNIKPGGEKDEMTQNCSNLIEFINSFISQVKNKEIKNAIEELTNDYYRNKSNN